MNGTHEHLTAGTIQDFLAGRLGEGEEAAVRNHLAICGRCSGRVGNYRLIETSLRKLPIERADDVLIEHILVRTGVSRRTDYRFADVMAGVMAAVFVGGILLVVFGSLGIIPIKTAIGGTAEVSAWMTNASQEVGRILDGFSAKVGVGPVSVSSLTLASLSLGVIGVLLGLDHVIERWMARGNGAR
ncbi:MAG TPA: zf-HC2 domain-containing protein [Bacteroidota bacterium]|nr:zf-HC2 domain-containing protein [Bacteroidota bacterium]